MVGQDGTVYAAPDLIYHYVVAHHYRPPDEFIQAVMETPLPGSQEYEVLKREKGLDNDIDIEWITRNWPKRLDKPENSEHPSSRETTILRLCSSEGSADCRQARPLNPLAGVHMLESEMILIPAGEFLMGSDSKKDKDADNKEQPQHSLYLPDYYLAKIPVTNAQYLAFVQAVGHEPPGYWQGGKPPSGKEEHPVVDVSWYDAMAYCRWLAEVTGKPYSLPSETEWEKGSRGPSIGSGSGRIYPWGDQWDAKRCNTGKGSKGDATPVGAYPLGASLYGLLDCAGNVWEWTRSLWGTDWKKPQFGYPYDSTDGRENLEAGSDILRVLRGGSCATEYSQRIPLCAICSYHSSPSSPGGPTCPSCKPSQASYLH